MSDFIGEIDDKYNLYMGPESYGMSECNYCQAEIDEPYTVCSDCVDRVTNDILPSDFRGEHDV